MREKILIICYKRPYPLKSGAEVSMHQYIKVLSKYYMIDVLYISDQKDEQDELNDICHNVIAFKGNRKTKLMRMLANCVIHNMPLQTAQMFYPKMAKWIGTHSEDYKLIFGIHIKMASYVMYLAINDVVPQNKLVFCGVDAISLQCYNAYQINKGWKKKAYFFEYKKMLAYEKKVYQTIKNTILISQRDKDYILNNVKAKCNPCIIPNYAVDLGYKEQIEKEQCSICFMGSMEYNPNFEAVSYFVNNIFPIIKKKYPKLEFHIIGPYKTKKIAIWNKINGVTVHGFVDNPAEYLQRSTLVIAPMRSGAGMQNKIIQAMYLGCTVITSQIGANGLAGLHGDELIVYYSDAELKEQLIKYLSIEYAEQREQIGSKAREYAKNNYSYNTIQGKIIDFFVNLK